MTTKNEVLLKTSFFTFFWLLLLLPGIPAGAAAPEALSLQAAYARMDAAYCRRDVPGIMALSAPGFTRTESGRTQSRAQARQELANSFQGTQSVHTVTRLKALVFSKNHAAASIVRRIDYTLRTPLPGVPPPYFVVEVSQDEWLKTPQGWRLKAMREPPLLTELNHLNTQDQAIRRQMVDDPKNLALAGQMAVSDAADRAAMKRIIGKYGWPGFDLVGTTGEATVWEIVQHSDADLTFQKYCLPLLRAAVRRGQAKPDSLALLTDRILKAEGKPQEYGTQIILDADRNPVAPPTVDPAHLDQRRASVGLPPMGEYLKQYRQFYQPKPKTGK